MELPYRVSLERTRSVSGERVVGGKELEPRRRLSPRIKPNVTSCPEFEVNQREMTDQVSWGRVSR